MKQNEWIQKIAAQYGTDITHGLSLQEVQKRLTQYGPNQLPEAQEDSWFSVFIAQFKNPLIYMLLAAAVIIFFVGTEKLDAGIIFGVLTFNAVIGTIQEGRTRSILQSLKRFIKTTSIVIRDGKKLLVDDADLVLGDIILLQEGERIPADAYLLEGNQLQVDEAILTGESSPVYKSAEQLSAAMDMHAPYMLFKGTYVLSGSGRALVCATGAHTQIGKIHRDVEALDTDMPLKKEVDRLSYVILLAVIAVCTLLFGMGIIAGQPMRELLVMLTALFICVVPEGLPVVMTLVLVTGVYRMAKQQVFVKRLQAVEGLGRTEVIAIDKTGTLTRNELMVRKFFVHDRLCEVTGQGYYPEGKVTCNNGRQLQEDVLVRKLGVACALLNTTEINYDELRHTFDIKGDPTEAALYVFAQKLGYDQKKLEKEYTKLYEMPFNPVTQMHAAFFNNGKEEVVFVIGAPERIFKLIDFKDIYDQQLAELLHDGLRVVAIAGSNDVNAQFFAQASDDVKHDIAKAALAECTLELYGLVGFQDTIRPEAHDMIKKARQAGLCVIMATGDHKDTALHIAKETGIFSPQNMVLTGAQMQELSDDQLLSHLDAVTVYARVNPQDKVRLIKLFHEKNKIIAMTGDGINDAPALVAADLGIAMGGIGTEVAQQAADIILLDDSFASIIRAIEQGRHIFYTLKRVILYFFATNMGEVLIILFALSLNLFGVRFPLPLTAAQILWLNLVTDGFLDVSLSMEPEEEGLLSKSWLATKSHLIDGKLILKVLWYAFPMACGSLWIFFQYYQQDLKLARTMTLLTMAMYQWFNAWNCRSETKSLFQVGLFSNPWLLASTSLVLLLQMLLLYAPPMQFIFKTVPLTLEQWLLVLALTAPIVLFDEFRKAIVRIAASDA